MKKLSIPLIVLLLALPLMLPLICMTPFVQANPDTYPITVQIFYPTNRTYVKSTIPVTLTYSTNGTDVTLEYNIWNITSGAFIYGENQTYTNPTTEILPNGKYTLHAEAENAEGYNATATRSFTVHVATTEENTLFWFGAGVIVVVMCIAFAIGAKKGLGAKSRRWERKYLPMP